MSNITYFWNSKTVVAEYVADLKRRLKSGSVLTTITTPAPLGGCYVIIVIEGSLEDIDETMAPPCYFSKHTTISTETIP